MLNKTLDDYTYLSRLYNLWEIGRAAGYLDHIELFECEAQVIAPDIYIELYLGDFVLVFNEAELDWTDILRHMTGKEG